MIYLEDLIEDLGVFDADTEVKIIIAENTGKITEMQREQMLEGRGSDGDFIRPFYSENPFFKTPEGAAKYAAWKQKITPNPKRPIDVPNLFIDGFFHDSLSTEVVGDMYDVESSAHFGDDVFDVHKNAAGLDEENSVLFAETITIPQFAKVFEQKTGLVIETV